MKKVIAYTTLVALIIVACGTSVFAQKKRKANPHAAGEDIYKHYSGTIGTKKITLDLRWGYQGGSNYGGSSIYSPDEDKITTLIIGEPASFDHGVPMTGYEEPEDTSLTSDDKGRWEGNPKWNFTIKGNKLTGKWQSADGKEQYDIALTEDYSNSLPLGVKVTDDTSIQTIPGTNKPLAHTSMVYVAPLTTTSAVDATLLKNALMSVTGMQSRAINNVSDFHTYYNRAFAAECMEAHDAQAIDITKANFFKMAFIMPIYNENGLMVLENEETDLSSPGMHSTRYSYVCVDFREHMLYSPDEIMFVDNIKIGELLEPEFRKKYNLDPKKPLSTWLKTNVMPGTHQFYPLKNGLVFVYNIGDLIDEKKMEMPMMRKHVSLYVPYTKLNEMLIGNFKNRMGL